MTTEEPMGRESMTKIHIWTVIAALCAAIGMGFTIHIANVLDHGLCLTADVTSASPTPAQLLTTATQHLATVLTGGRIEGVDR